MKNIALPRTVKAPAAVIAALLMLAGILFAPPSPAVAAPLPDHLVTATSSIRPSPTTGGSTRGAATAT